MAYEPRSKMSSGVIGLQFVSKEKKSQARFLRINATDTEKLLWESIRNRKLGGFKFRRQQIIEGFIADFYCEAAKLVLEIDGGVHDIDAQQVIDKHRDIVFKLRGISVLRIRNEMLLADSGRSFNLILDTIKKRIG
jgi:very-short-patch-repair endonuclease